MLVERCRQTRETRRKARLGRVPTLGEVTVVTVVTACTAPAATHAGVTTPNTETMAQKNGGSGKSVQFVVKSEFL